MLSEASAAMQDKQDNADKLHTVTGSKLTTANSGHGDAAPNTVQNQTSPSRQKTQNQKNLKPGAYDESNYCNDDVTNALTVRADAANKDACTSTCTHLPVTAIAQCIIDHFSWQYLAAYSIKGMISMTVSAYWLQCLIPLEKHLHVDSKCTSLITYDTSKAQTI